MREDLQKSFREAQQRNSQFSEGEKRLAAEIGAIQQQRRYAAVGRLIASTVYDGVTLPKMYRVVSLDGFGRSIGYVAPSADFEVESRLGLVVGIVGEARFDEALRLNIIKPERIDALTVTRAGRSSCRSRPRLRRPPPRRRPPRRPPPRRRSASSLDKAGSNAEEEHSPRRTRRALRKAQGLR